jgi:PKHD-type hydroxylase
MRKIQQQFWQWEASIDPAFCDSVVKEHFEDAEKREAAVLKEDSSYDLDAKKRKTTIAWAESGTEIFDTVYDYIKAANESGGWYYDISGMEPVQIGEYTDGGYYGWHSDIDSPCVEDFQRKLSCSIQLSDFDEYEGGDLILENSQGMHFTAPRQKGSVIVFPSFLKHKVTPVTKGIRYSAVGWMRGPAFK